MMRKASNKAMWALKEVQTSTNAASDANQNAERQGKQKKDSGIASDATMSKADYSQEKFDEGKVTKVNSHY